MELLNFEGQSVLDSRDVAKMIGKEHKNLMRDIRTYTKDIEESSKLSARIFLFQVLIKANRERFYQVTSSLNRDANL